MWEGSRCQERESPHSLPFLVIGSKSKPENRTSLLAPTEEKDTVEWRREKEGSRGSVGECVYI